MKLFLSGLLGIGILAIWITPYMVVASLNFLVLCVGYSYRKQNKKLHAALMSLGMTSDLVLVLILEFQRDAIATAVAMNLSFLEQAHIFCSTVATLLYFPIFIFGALLLKGKFTARLKTLHLRFGTTALVFRTAGFLLMFSMLGKVHQS